MIGEPTGYWQDCVCRSTVTEKEFLRPSTYVLANEITNDDVEIGQDEMEKQ